MRYRVMRMASCLCHIAQCVGGEIEAVNQTFGESSVGICFVLFLERAFLPHFRVFAVSVRHPCGNCLSDKRWIIAGRMTEHLRLQGKICFARPKPLALEEFVHEFQVLDQPAWQHMRNLFPPDIEIISPVPDFALEGAGIDVRHGLPA